METNLDVLVRSALTFFVVIILTIVCVTMLMQCTETEMKERCFKQTNDVKCWQLEKK